MTRAAVAVRVATRPSLVEPACATKLNGSPRMCRQRSRPTTTFHPRPRGRCHRATTAVWTATALTASTGRRGALRVGGAVFDAGAITTIAMQNSARSKRTVGSACRRGCRDHGTDDQRRGPRWARARGTSSANSGMRQASDPPDGATRERRAQGELLQHRDRSDADRAWVVAAGVERRYGVVATVRDSVLPRSTTSTRCVVVSDGGFESAVPQPPQPRRSLARCHGSGPPRLHGHPAPSRRCHGISMLRSLRPRVRIELACRRTVLVLMGDAVPISAATA